MCSIERKKDNFSDKFCNQGDTDDCSMEQPYIIVMSANHVYVVTSGSRVLIQASDLNWNK